MDVRFSNPPARPPSIEAIWTPILDGRRRRCRRDDLHPVPAHRPAGEADTRSQLALFARYSTRLQSPTGTGDAGTGGRSSPSRTAICTAWGCLGPLRRQRRLAGTGDGAQPGPLDSPHRPGSADRVRRRVFALAGVTPRHADWHRGPWEEQFPRPVPTVRASSTPSLTAPSATEIPAAQPRSASASCRVLSRHLARHSHCRPPSVPPKAPADRPPTSRLPKFEPGSSRLSLTPFRCPHVSSRRPSLSIGGFGVRGRSPHCTPPWVSLPTSWGSLP